MPCDVVDFAPLLCIGRSMEQYIFLLLNGLVLTIPTIRCVDLLIFPLLLL
jgi:hypothetical protein